MKFLKTVLLFVVLAIVTSAVTASCHPKIDPSEYTEEEKEAKDVSHSGSFAF